MGEYRVATGASGVHLWGPIVFDGDSEDTARGHTEASVIAMVTLRVAFANPCPGYAVGIRTMVVVAVQGAQLYAIFDYHCQCTTLAVRAHRHTRSLPARLNVWRFMSRLDNLNAN